MKDLQEKKMTQLRSGGEDLACQTSLEDLIECPEMALTRALEVSDKLAHKPQLLHDIGDTFLSLFRSTKALRDINNSVRAYELAAQLLTVTDANLAGFLHDYSISVLERYNLTGTAADIDKATSSLRKAIQNCPKGHAELPARLNSLGMLLRTRFMHIGDPADISEAISFLQKSIQLTPDSAHADLSACLNNLGVLLQTRFERTGDLADIAEALSLQHKSIQLTPEHHADLPGRLNSLGNSLQTRFERTGDLTDNAEALSLQHKSIQLTPDGHADLPGRLHSLGISLLARFKRTGDLPDITEAILSLQKSVQLTPAHHRSLPARLDNIGISLRIRSERTGNLADLSEAVSWQQKAVQLTPEGHPGLPIQLTNLGNSLRRRFNCTGDLADISEAISYQQKSVQLTPDGHASLPGRLNNLGVAFRRRFERTGDLADISEAISSQQKSVQLTPEAHATLPGRLNNLGNSLLRHFNRTKDLADISKAILCQQKAIQLTPEGHVYLRSWLHNLGSTLRARFERTGDLADISEAIASHQKSVQLTPEGHTDLPLCLIDVGNSFRTRFECTKDAVDFQNAIFHYRLSATSVSGPPSTSLSAAKQWAVLAQKFDRSQLLDAYHAAIHLISKVAGLEKTIQNRYSNLIDISELSASAAAAAFDSEHHDLALEWLEQGRCLVWSQLNDLRSPIDNLRAHDPILADEIVRVSRSLECSGSRAEPAANTADTTMATKISIQDDAHTHIKLSQEWDQLLIKVRAIPQFEHFLRPASCSTLLKSLPESGHVVVINVHQNRSDALVLTSGAKEPLHIPLPEFPYEKANTLRHQLKNILLDSRIRMRGAELDDTRGSRRYMPGIADVLRQLWTFVVKPILDGMGYSVPASEIPRIWWCVTGPLAFLPIHAAGIYAPAEPAAGISTTLSDFAISSYTPTVRSLVEMVRKPREIAQEKMGMLMISQPDTPKLRRIPGTTVEVGAIQRLLANHKAQHLRLDSRDATVNRVKTSMETHSCIHFACHASQDTTKPLQSGFYLYDGRLELSEIIKEHLMGADLAFLSACQTSTGDEKLSEEAVHLAGGMLAAGYRGVVATMWSIKDSYGPKVAEDFYKHLLSHGPDEENGSKKLSSEGAAHALHYAMQQFRKTLDNSEVALLTWVPYVHFGL